MIILQIKRGVGDSRRLVPSASVLGLTSAVTGKKGRTTCSHIQSVHGHEYLKMQNIAL